MVIEIIKESYVIDEPIENIRPRFDAKLKKSLLNFLEEVKMKEGFSIIPLPEIKLITIDELFDMLGARALIVKGFYSAENETIYIPYNELDSVENLLHEFYHHIQLKKYGMKHFPKEELDKPHCQRSYEHEAKEFALRTAPKYKSKYIETLKTHFKMKRALIATGRINGMIVKSYLTALIPKDP